MADIVLKDRNGNDVQYPGVNYINVNTVDGGTQGFAAYDPETLTPENLPVGVTVGDVEGALDVPEMLEDMPIAVDFSGGDMEITAPDGYAVKSAVIQKPTNLLPENIAKDVDVGGIVGTLEGGGGGERTPCIFRQTRNFLAITYNSSSSKWQTLSQNLSVTLPKGSVVLSAAYSTGGVRMVSNTTYLQSQWYTYTVSLSEVTIDQTDQAVIVSKTISRNYQGYYSAIALALLVDYYLPGYTTEIDSEQNIIVRADDSVVDLPASTVSPLPNIMDLSKSQITTIPEMAFYNSCPIEIFFPATVASMEAYIVHSRTTILDLSRSVTIPIIQSDTFSNLSSSAQIKVPAALYDEWITATNWSKYANQIVAV